jgi:hypothetical protein
MKLARKQASGYFYRPPYDALFLTKWEALLSLTGLPISCFPVSRRHTPKLRLQIQFKHGLNETAQIMTKHLA